VDVPEDLLRDPAGVLLRLRWTGDLARAYVGDVLVADQFYSGRVWDIGLDRLPAGALLTKGLRLEVLPLARDAPVHVPGQSGDAWREARVRDAAWVVMRRWSVRTG
ncbi:glycosyl hydrolase family 35, partial [Streptomyces sp. NPDC006265]